MLALTACTAGDTTTPDGGPRRDLAVTPHALPPETTPAGTPVVGGTPSGRPGSTAGAATPTGAASASAGTPGGPSAPGATSPVATSPGAAPPRRTRLAGSAGDARGDAGPGVPAYADVVSVSVEDDDAGNAVVTVRFAGDVPARLPAEEVSGVGVDFFRTAAQVESDYQLFADGQPEGWFAYLQTPQGFVKYPGTFGVGGNRLVFTVPWSALGDPRAGRFSAFADWTRSGAVNTAGEDHAPDLGTASYAR